MHDVSIKSIWNDIWTIDRVLIAASQLSSRLSDSRANQLVLVSGKNRSDQLYHRTLGYYTLTCANCASLTDTRRMRRREQGGEISDMEGSAGGWQKIW
jgi:hypothetical protein